MLKKIAPWWLKIIIKIFISRLPINYHQWSSMNLFRHGNPENQFLYVDKFTKHFNLAFPNKKPKDFVCLELGPGDSIATGIIANAFGAKKTYLFDVGDFAIKDINYYKEFSKKIIVEYKPHPREFNEQEPDYFTELRNAGVVISHKHADLYEILAKSRWQVGIYSTTLYEGLYFGTACFVVNTTRAFHMKRLIELDFARLISSPKDIDLNWKIEKKDMETFFSKPSQKNIEYVISLFK